MRLARLPRSLMVTAGAGLFCLAPVAGRVGMAADAPADTTSRTSHIHVLGPGGIPRPSPFDCDGNFVPDSLDIAEGYAIDSNHNGIPDSCEPDTTLLWSTASQRWRDQDTVFFSSAYLRGQSVLLRYTVPKSKAKVRIEIRSAAGQLTRTLFVGDRVRGSYEEHWDRRNDAGKLVSAGAYDISLMVDKEKRSARVRWASWP